jgi:hypothetical protein
MKQEQNSTEWLNWSSSKELYDYDAWKGYEFWAAQLEAGMEPLDENDFLDGDLSAGRASVAEFYSERQSDVLPF